MNPRWPCPLRRARLRVEPQLTMIAPMHPPCPRSDLRARSLHPIPLSQPILQRPLLHPLPMTVIDPLLPHSQLLPNIWVSILYLLRLPTPPLQLCLLIHSQHDPPPQPLLESRFLIDSWTDLHGTVTSDNNSANPYNTRFPTTTTFQTRTPPILAIPMEPQTFTTSRSLRLPLSMPRARWMVIIPV